MALTLMLTGGGVEGIRFAGAGFAAGVVAVSEAGVGGTGVVVFFGFPHPPPATKATMRQKIPAPGFQPLSLQKLK